MIDVALKVGELTGGMAEGSVVTFRTNEEPFSRHMKTVFAMIRLQEDQLPLIKEAMESTPKRPRRSRIPLRALAHALNRPGLERRWRSCKAVETVDVSRLDLRRILRRGYKVRHPKHRDLNVVSSGYYTVGKEADYADWNAVLADISTSIGGELVFTQISDLSYAMAGVTGNIVLATPDAKIILKSASVLKGNGGTGLLTEDTARTSVGMSINARALEANEAAYIEIKDLFFRSHTGASPGGSFAFIKTNGWWPDQYPLFKIHDCIFFGNAKNGHGIEITTTDQHFQIWNCKFDGLSGIGIRIQTTGNAESFIENCVFTGNLHGTFQNNPDLTQINNCVGFGNTTKDFATVSSKGDNNVSEDASAADFDGSDNLANQADLDQEFVDPGETLASGYLRLKPDAALLPAAGKAPEIPDNTMGCTGNNRPGTDGTYSVGADELEEVFPTAWGIYTKLTINSEKISGGSPFTMPILITEKAFMITDEIWNNSKDDGGDLRLTTGADGSGMVPLEVVGWDRVNRKCELWALAEVSPTADTELYLWAGNGHAAQPEFNDTRDSRGRFYIWENPDSTREAFVYHCANDPAEKYAYDSSPAKNHGPVYSSNPLTQIASPWGYGYAFKFDETLSEWITFGANKYEFTNGANDAYAMMQLKKIVTDGAALLQFNVNASTAVRFQLKDQGGAPGFAVYAVAPDGGALQAHSSGSSLSDLGPHIVGAHVDLVAKLIDSWVDGNKASSAASGFGSTVFSGGTHNLATIGFESAGAASRFYAQELRFWSLDYGSFSDNDNFWETHNTMVTEQVSFWSCGDLHGQSQVGPRKWQFVVPEFGCFGVENTDFWIEYTANIDGTLSAILHAVWDAGSGTGLIGVTKRVELENRLEELRHSFETLRGDLLIDEGTSYEKLIRGVQLSAVTLKEGKTNAALDYDLTFVFGLAGLGMRSIARSLEFGAVVLNAGNFLIEYVGGDNTVFKDVFRAAPIRVPSGPVAKSIFVGAIVESIAASTPLARRQKAEAKIKEWAWDHLGTEGELKIDGVSLGTAHLANAQASQLELPDAVVFDLEFITGYGS